MRSQPRIGMLLLCAGLAAGCADRNPKFAAEVKPVPRNRTVILCSPDSSGGRIGDFDSFNPFLPSVTRSGYNFLYEPLYFFSAHRGGDGVIPWIATNHTYNADFTEVTVDIRPGVTWSDGTPWTAEDVAFTIEMLKSHAPKLTFSSEMKTWVAEAKAEGDLRVRIQLTKSNPRFLFDFFTFNFDNGVAIVPAHIWKGRDPMTFVNLDVSRGWPVVSGPYRLVYTSPRKRFWDRRDDWWGAKTGFSNPPKVERVIYVSDVDEGKRIQLLMTDEIDSCVDLRPANIRTALDHNPRLTTWAGRKVPFGYVDWWPTLLGFNDGQPPFDDRRLRWAVNHALNRDAILQVGWQGCGTTSLLPFPDFPGLREYTGRIGAIVEKSGVGRHDLGASAALMTEMGYKRDADGLWSKDGKRLTVVIEVFEVFKDIAPLIVAQLRQAGFDASFRMTEDTFTRMAQGRAQAYLFGCGGSVRDPFASLSAFHSRHIKPTGTYTYPTWRWANRDFDAAVDRMAAIPSGAPEMHAAFAEAMEIWLRELPAIPLLQWYHRVPHNQTYWQNWPCEENPYINSAYWHRTWLLVLLGLTPVK